MQEFNWNKQNEVIIEKMKERPVNKKKLLRRTIITASMAVIFGLIACVTFLILEPVISKWLYPEEKTQIVVFPEDQEEMSPEEMLADNMEQEQQQMEQQLQEQLQNQQAAAGNSSAELNSDQIQQILQKVTFDLKNYEEMYSAMAAFSKEMRRSMVTVTGVVSNLDWFNNVQESENQASGVIIANNGKELLILVDYAPLKSAESLHLTFNNDLQVPTYLKKLDEFTNLAILTVNLEDFDNSYLEKGITIAAFGSSNLSRIVGQPVVALGRPMGTEGSIGYGMITSSGTSIQEADTNYKLIQTDITGSEKAGGVLFNLQGQVVGIITNSRGSLDMKNMITAYGITELKNRIEQMANGRQKPYMGICGVNVTREANLQLNVPYGAYVTEIDMDSPAMMAGIQQGDVIVAINGKEITSYNMYINTISSMSGGDNLKVLVMRQVQEEYKEMEFDVVLEERN